MRCRQAPAISGARLISDSYALGILAEAPGLGILVDAERFVNSALASRPPLEPATHNVRAFSLAMS